jgi:BirA family transcriptional regulator, biotin operon repressor / biotin---[acetyl-CoA-carboxylase] ligase
MRTGALAEALYEAMLPVWPGVAVDVLPDVDSTNTQLLQRPRLGDTSPALMLALNQSAGRGRIGRAWHGKPGDALMMSLACELAPADWAGLSLAVGVAAASALHPEITLKWPNDLWLGKGDQGRKLGGILIETASLPHAAPNHRWCVLGLGINLQPPAAQEPLRTPAAGLRELLPEIDVDAAALAVAPAVVRAVQRFEATGFAPFAAAFAQRDALAGSGVRLSDGLSGQAQGVAADGAMLVHTEQGLRRVSSDEVSVFARLGS